MGFDKNSPQGPIIHAERKATQVNLWVVVGVAVLLIVALVYIVHAHQHPGSVQNAAAQSVQQKP
ncbi:MAG TPA: hypothetical protein VGL42_09855 [Opitutaceae bacterium]|jgi:hypothetical protein